MPMELLSAAVTRKDVDVGMAEVSGTMDVRLTVGDLLSLMAALGTDVLSMEADDHDMTDERHLMMSMVQLAQDANIINMADVMQRAATRT